MLMRKLVCRAARHGVTITTAMPCAAAVTSVSLASCRRQLHHRAGRARADLSAAPPPSSPPPQAPSASPLPIPRLEFSPPTSMTHEGLAYAACPACGANYHMGDMLLHLTLAHKHLDPERCRRICQGRLNLYRRVVGVPLAKAEPRSAGGAALASSLSTGPSAPPSLVANALSPLMHTALSQLPTVTALGAYQCNWCVQRSGDFPTRDALLKHMIHEHPELPLDDLEPHIPMPPARRQPAHGDGSGRADDGAASVWRSAPGHEDKGFFGRALQRQRSGTRGPTRTLPGATTALSRGRAENAASNGTAQKTLSGLAARQVGITLPRMLDAAAGVGKDEGRDGALASLDVSTLVFSETHFPCELCGKAFESELNLLQHLEGKHPNGVLEAETETTASGSEAAASADIAQFQREEAAGVSPGHIYALCDLCGASRVYTLPSALYAHIRFKHPTEDAAFHVDRILEASKGVTPLVCPHCARGFATQDALDGHVADKHSQAAGATGAEASSSQLAPSSSSSPGSRGTLPPVTAKNRWWCNDCEKGFGMAKALHGHMVGKHRLPTQVFPCPACKRIFTDVHSLEEHFGVQHRAMNLKDLGIETHVSCPECERLFLSTKELERHRIRHHARRRLQQKRQQQQQQPHQTQRAAALSSSSSATAATADRDGTAAFETPDTAAVTKLETPAAPRKVARRRSSSANGFPGPS